MYSISQTTTFDRWLRRLRDIQAKARIAQRIEMIELGHFGDHKSVGDGVSELRSHAGPGYRVYYTIREQRVVILLVGGDKGSQEADIEKAKRMARNY